MIISETDGGVEYAETGSVGRRGKLGSLGGCSSWRSNPLFLSVSVRHFLALPPARDIRLVYRRAFVLCVSLTRNLLSLQVCQLLARQIWPLKILRDGLRTEYMRSENLRIIC